MVEERQKWWSYTHQLKAAEVKITDTVDAPVPIPVSGLGTDTGVEYSTPTRKLSDDTQH